MRVVDHGRSASNRISDDGVAFFKENGYLLIPGALPLELCDEACDLRWSRLPAGSDMRRDDPNTHLGPFSARDTQLEEHNHRRNHRWKLREIATEPLLTTLAYSSRLCTVAEQLLGTAMLRRPVVDGAAVGGDDFVWGETQTDLDTDATGVRGIYCTLPFGDRRGEPDGIHTDAHPMHLGMVGLLDDVAPDGGAFKVWPKSHRRLYPTFYLQYDQPRVLAYDHLPSYSGILCSPETIAELERIDEDTEPVDCWGSKGDVVLWHHRLAHAAADNYTDRIRIAILADYNRVDLDAARRDRPQPDMWCDWSSLMQAADGGYSQEFARQQRLVG